MLYQQLKSDKKMHEEVLKGYEEHHLVAMIMRELERNNPSKDEWHAKFTVLSESLEHHLQEEENTMFPEAQQILGEEKSAQMANQYESATRQFAKV